MDCQQARNLIAASALIRRCDPVRGDMLRLETAFEYPGNEYVDLYVRPAAADAAGVELTDAAGTIGQLLSFGLDPDKTPRRRRFITDVCEQLGVVRRGGELVAVVPEPIEAQFGMAAIRLGQACVRIADLIVTHSTRLTSTFEDEIEEGLDALPVTVDKGVSLRGSKGQDVAVDFLIHAPRLPAAVLAVSASTRGAAKTKVDATLRKWIELQNVERDYQFVTLLDSRRELWSESDRGLLGDYSEVFAYPAEADSLRELVTAQ